MRVLLLSTIVYLGGIAAVLFVRPALMFDHQGRWKEFGLRSEENTVFPFWLFCIIWAAVSYFLGSITLPAPVEVIQAAPVAASITNTVRNAMKKRKQEVREIGPEEEDAITPLPVPGPTQKGGSNKPRRRLPKGYYIYVGGDEEAEEEVAAAEAGVSMGE